MENQETNCPLCKNHCPIDALNCRRGQKYFQQGTAEYAAFDHAQAPDTPSAGTQEDRLMDLFRRCSHTLRHAAHSHHGGLGRVLHFLHRHGPMTQRDLQEHAGIKSASMSELLQKGEAGGLLMRNCNRNDKRILDVSLTEQGIHSIQEAMQSQKQPPLFAALSAEEAASLEALLTKLLASWGQEDTPCQGRCRHGGLGRRGHGRFSPHHR